MNLSYSNQAHPELAVVEDNVSLRQRTTIASTTQKYIRALEEGEEVWGRTLRCGLQF